MNSYPEYALVNNHKYKINTDFRYAIECDRIARDTELSDTKRSLGVLYTLFGDKIFEYPDDWNKLLKVALKYLTCGKELHNEEEPDMDYTQDKDYIEASFMSDYGIDLEGKEMHWYKFSNLINGLSNSELGNCCVLNRIRNIRNQKLSDIKDPKMREELRKQKKEFALKKDKKEREFTDEEIKNMNEFDEALGINK